MRPERITSLDEALARARAHRPAVQAAQQRLREAELTGRALGVYPATRGSLGYTSDPDTGGSDEDAVITQPIDIFGRSGAGRALGNAQVMQARADVQRTLLDIQAEVIANYVEAAASTELARIAAGTESIVQRLFNATETRVQEGVAPGVQLTRVGIELERARATRLRREAERNSALARLAAATGQPANVIAVEGLPLVTAPALSPEELQSTRPDLMLLLAEARTAEAEAWVANLERAPELEVQARRTPWQEGSPKVGARVQLSFPLLDHGRTTSNVRASRARAQSRRLALADAMKLATGELTATRIEVESASEQIRRAELIVQAAKTLVERSQTGLTEGATTLLEVLDSLRALREADEALVEARSSLAQAQIRQLQATGHLLGASR